MHKILNSKFMNVVVNVSKKVFNFMKNISYEDAIMRFVGIFFLVSSYNLHQNRFYIFKAAFTTKEYYKFISFKWIFLWMLFLFVIFSVLHFFFKKRLIDAILLLVGPLFYIFLTLWSHMNMYYMFGCIIMESIIIIYLMKDDKLCLKKFLPNTKQTIIIVGLFAVLYASFVSLVTVCRYVSYRSSTYDFGIFAQMYHYMRETFTPKTTCERQMLLSHFAVHLSPIYYLLLPVYFIFPSPITLQISQAVVIASGVIPLYLLCKRRKLSNKAIISICFCYCFFPALITGCFYDFHENMFLPPLILWFLYLMEKKSWFMYIPLGLTLMVKEDAAIYTTCIALFMIISKKEYKHGFITLGGSLAYFGFSMWILKTFGQGAMTNRLDNFMIDGSLLSIFKMIFMNPGYLVSQMISGVEKFNFIIQMLLPLLFVPFFSRKISQLILLFPLLVINLMPAYQYQYNIYFQYIYGSSTLLIYLCVINYENFRERQSVFACMMATCAIVCLTYVSPYYDNLTFAIENRKTSEIMDRELAKLDTSKSALATGYILPHIANRKVVYDYAYYNDKYSLHYIALDRRPGCENQEALSSFIFTCVSSHNYKVLVDIPNVITILELSE